MDLFKLQEENEMEKKKDGLLGKGQLLMMAENNCLIVWNAFDKHDRKHNI